jgi:hypothetical protein
MNEIPQRQSVDWIDDFEHTVNAGFVYFKNRWLKTEIDPLSIQKTVQLGPGYGMDSGAFLTLFSNSQFHLVDYHASVHPSILENPRVVFYHGLFTDVLENTDFGNVDLVIMRFTSRYHGFTKDNITLLRRLVGNGILFTDEDNGGLEKQPWFQKQFTLFKMIEPFQMNLWKGNS